MEFSSKVMEAKQETHDVKMLRFSAPPDFTFKPGQFIMLELDIEGKKDTRTFSICSSPTKHRFIEIAKKIGDSEYSKKLGELKEGDEVRIKGPFGLFVLDESRDAILLAGGIGVTPFRCYIEYAADKKLRNKIALFYSNKMPEDIAFRSEFADFSKMSSNIRIISTVTRPEESKEKWTDVAGRIDENMIRHHISTMGISIDSALFYVCGPPAMVEAMVTMVKGMGIAQNMIKIERFTGY